MGPRLMALALLAWSAWVLHGVVVSHAPTANHALTLASAALLALTFAAAASLWGRSGSAFALYALWAVAAMATLVLLRLHLSGSAHLVRFMPTILMTGLMFAAGAIVLRRAV